MSKESETITFANMTVCSAATGISKHRLRRAKAAGCSAFLNSGRVALRPLVEWFLTDRATAAPDSDNLERLRAARAAREELKLKLEDSRAYPADRFDDAITRTISAMQRELQRRLVAVIPGEGAHLSARELKRVMESHYTNWCDYCQRQADTLQKKSDK